MKYISLILFLLFSATLYGEKAPPEEELRRWWTFSTGKEVLVLKPDKTPNWTPEMNAYAGKTAKVTELLGKDSDGFYMLKLDVDEGFFSWRARNIADPHSTEAGALTPLYVKGTDIPQCVIPIRNGTPLYSAADGRNKIGTVPSIESVDSDGQQWFLPRFLYVHAASNGFLEVMESDLSSRKTLGWVDAKDMNEWITRQGYIINYARASKKKATMVRGYIDKKDIGRPGKEVFSEKLTRTRNADPNIIGVPDGLLVGKNSEAYKGMDVVQCAMQLPGSMDYTIVYMPVRSTLRPSMDTIIPVALLAETELQELEAMAHILYAACDSGAGRVDEIRAALTKNWDMTSKIVVGTERRNQQFAQSYKNIQHLFPALTAGLALPPGEAPEKTFKEVGERAECIARNAGRILDDMRRNKRNWSWVSLAELY